MHRVQPLHQTPPRHLSQIGLCTEFSRDMDSVYCAFSHLAAVKNTRSNDHGTTGTTSKSVLDRAARCAPIAR